MAKSKDPKSGATTVIEHEKQEVARANATGNQPVVFLSLIHI